MTDGTYRRSPWFALAARLALAGSSFALAGCASTASPSLEAFWNAADTPGAALAITETGRRGAGFATVATYALAVSGLPPGEGYRIAIRRTDGTGAVPIDDAVIAESGKVLVRNSTSSESVPVEINARSMAPGEPLEIRVIAAEGGSQATAEVVPRPLQSPEDAGCHLSARFERRPRLAYRVTLSGFQPDERVTLSIRNSRGTEKAVAARVGRSISVPIARVLREPTTISIAAASPTCRAEAKADFRDVPR